MNIEHEAVRSLHVVVAVDIVPRAFSTSQYGSYVGPRAATCGVEGFWESERADGSRFERVLPTGRAQVVVDLDNGVATLVGPRTVSAIVMIPQRAVGFSLSGCGLARVVGGDACDLVDSTVDLRDLGCDAQRVFDATHDRGAVVRELACRLIGRFEVDQEFVVAERLLRSGTPARAVSDRLGVDRRRFVPAFRSVVGLAPKQYAVLGRFQRANCLLRSGAGRSQALIAFELGYADQAHMTREVRRLAGCTPSQLRVLPAGPANHVPLFAASM